MPISIKDLHLICLINVNKSKFWCLLIRLGFGDVKNPCCQVVSTEDGGNATLCTKGGAMCEDRNQFLFLYGLHPTEAVNVVLATKGFNSNLTSDVYPFSIRKLTEIWCHHLWSILLEYNTVTNWMFCYLIKKYCINNVTVACNVYGQGISNKCFPPERLKLFLDHSYSKIRLSAVNKWLHTN